MGLLSCVTALTSLPRPRPLAAPDPSATTPRNSITPSRALAASPAAAIETPSSLDPARELSEIAAPTPGLQRLIAYRYDEDERYREKLANSFLLWLAAALASPSGAELRLDLTQQGAAVSYAPATLLAPLIPEGSWERNASASASDAAFTCKALITGEPARSPWDALCAATSREGAVRIRVRALPLPPTFTEDCLAQLAGAAAALDQRHSTRTLPHETRSLRDPAAAAWQDRIDRERERVSHAAGFARIAILVSAECARDLDTACTALLAAMAPAGVHGAPAPQRIDLDRAMQPANTSGAALTAIATCEGIVHLLLPPTEPVRGLTVVNASVGPAARHAFSTTGGTTRSDRDAIVLGTTEVGAACSVPVAQFAAHAVITGMPGMRKSTCAALILHQLMAYGVNVVVLEPSKCEYHRLLAGAGPLRIHGAEGAVAPLGVNPFAVDPGVRPALWLQTIASCMVSALGMAEAPLPLYLEGLIRRLYHTRGIDLEAPASPHARWPTVADFLAEVDPYVEEECLASPEIRANVRAALTLRARSLADQPAFRAERGLMAANLTQGNRILRLADLGEEGAAFAGMILLARVAATIRRASAQPLRTVFALEEAHALLEDPQTGEPTRFARLYTQLLAEARAAGVGFITIDQRPSLLPEGVLSNSVTRICFASAHQRDREAAARSLGLTPFQEQRLGSLAPGRAVFATAGFAGPDLITLVETLRSGR